MEFLSAFVSFIMNMIGFFILLVITVVVCALFMKITGRR